MISWSHLWTHFWRCIQNYLNSFHTLEKAASKTAVRELGYFGRDVLQLKLSDIFSIIDINHFETSISIMVETASRLGSAGKHEVIVYFSLCLLEDITVLVLWFSLILVLYPPNLYWSKEFLETSFVVRLRVWSECVEPNNLGIHLRWHISIGIVKFVSSFD